MLHYILQVIFFQLSFLLVYELLLKKETFFNYNRWYLLLTPVISFLLPFLQFQGLSELVPAENMAFLSEVYIGEVPQPVSGAEVGTAVAKGFQINWWWLFYSVGAALSLFLFLRKALHLKQLFQGRLLSETNQVRIIQIPNTKIACTFYNTVFVGGLLSETEKEHILSHEIVHVRQKHSLDLLYFEMLKIVCWFNPLVYIFQSRIAGVHEYIADSHVVKSTEKRSYYQQLLNTAFNTENISFINQFFNHSLIKKRIVMLQKSKSKAVAKFKYLVLVPLLAGMLTYVSCSKESYDDTLNTQEAATIEVVKESDKSSEATGDIPFVVIEEVPVFPGCEELSTNDERKTCMSEKLNAYVNENFNTGLGKELGLQGVNRIYVQFRITKTGDTEVMGVRGPHPALEEEAERLVMNLPQMEPGRHKGEPAPVIYSLPIVLNIPGDGTNQEQAQQKQKSAPPVSPTGDIPFAVIDEVPVFPGCEGLSSAAERRACMTQKVNEHISENFDYGLAEALGVDQPTRVYVQFKISETGEVAVLGVRAPHPELGEEARHVVEGLPNMTPGKHGGQPRGVLYSLPITLNSNE